MNTITTEFKDIVAEYLLVKKQIIGTNASITAAVAEFETLQILCQEAIRDFPIASGLFRDSQGNLWEAVQGVETLILRVITDFVLMDKMPISDIGPLKKRLLAQRVLIQELKAKGNKLMAESLRLLSDQYLVNLGEATVKQARIMLVWQKLGIYRVELKHHRDDLYYAGSIQKYQFNEDRDTEDGGDFDDD